LGPAAATHGLTKANIAAKQQASCQYQVSGLIDESDSPYAPMAGLAAHIAQILGKPKRWSLLNDRGDSRSKAWRAPGGDSAGRP
jgi:hypothetical protein